MTSITSLKNYNTGFSMSNFMNTCKYIRNREDDMFKQL